MYNISNNFTSKNIPQAILYFITLSLTVSYIINNQSLAIVSLFSIAGITYYATKNIILALIISIIITNLLLSMKYLETTYVEHLTNPIKKKI